MDELERFNTNFNEMEFLDENGKPIKEDPAEYFKKKQEPTYLERLNIGDIAQIKKVGYSVKVEYVDYEVENVGIFNYAGHKVDNLEDNLILFNQSDIECKVENKIR